MRDGQIVKQIHEHSHAPQGGRGLVLNVSKNSLKRKREIIETIFSFSVIDNFKTACPKH